MRARGLRHEEHAEDVGLEGAEKLVFGDVANVLVGMLLPGVVDEHVDPAETVDDLADRLFAERRVADIACDGDGIPPFVPDDSGGLFRIVMFAQIRSEEHTSELQSLMRISYAVFCLKKKNSLQIH